MINLILRPFLIIAILTSSLNNTFSAFGQHKSEKDIYGREIKNSNGEKKNYSRSESQNLNLVSSDLKPVLKSTQSQSQNSAILKDTIQLKTHNLFSIMGSSIGRKSMHSLDIDKDGILDLICAGTKYNVVYGSFWYVMNYDPEDNSYKQVWTSSEYEHRISVIEVVDIDDDGNYNIIIGFENGKIQVYDAVSKELLKETYLGNEEIKSIVYADADNDSQKEIVVSCFRKCYLLNASSLETEFEIDQGANEIRVGNMDENEQNEIVLSSGKVYLLINDSLTMVWEFNNLSDGIVELSDIDGDSIQEVIIAENWYYIQVYDVDTKTTKYTIKVDLDISALLLSDVNNDGVDEIIYGDGQWGSIHCLNSVSQVEMWSVNNPDSRVTAINFSDIDKDGSKELIWGGGYSSETSHLYVYDVSSELLEWKSAGVIGPFYAVAIGDVDGDSQEDIVAISNKSGDGPGVIIIMDAKTKQIKWQSTGDFLSGLWTGVYDVAINDVDKDGLNEIIIAAGQSYTGAIWIINGRDHSIESFNEFYGMGLDEFYTLSVEDIDDDGTIEIITATHSDVCVINPKDWSIEWRVILTNNFYNTPIVKCADITGNGKKEVIYCNGALSILNSDDHSVWNSTETDYLNIDTVDYNKDGVTDLVASTSTGKIVILDGSTKTILLEIAPESTPISSIKTLPYDDSVIFIYSNDGRINYYIDEDNCTVSQCLGSSVAEIGGVQFLNNSNFIIGTSLSFLQVSGSSVHCASMGIEIEKNIVSCGINDGNIKLNIKGGSAPYSIVWDDNSILDYQQNLAPGNYSVQVQDMAGCKKKRNIVLSEAYIEADVEVIDEGCIDKGSVSVNIIHSTPPYSVEWSNSITGLENNSLSAGTYSVRIVDSKNCVFEESLEVKKNTIKIETIANHVSCNGASDGSIQLNTFSGVDPLVYKWSNGENKSHIYNLNPGIYQAEVTDSLGCKSDIEVEITQPDVLKYNLLTSPDIEDTPNWEGKIIVNNITGGTSPYSVFWTDFDIYTHYLDVLPNGTYDFVLTDYNNCMIFDTAILYTTIVTGVEEIKGNPFQIFPNPATDKLYIQSETTEFSIHEIVLINTAGKIVKKQSGYNNRDAIDLSGLNSGLYIMKIRHKDSVFYKKIIIK